MPLLLWTTLRMDRCVHGIRLQFISLQFSLFSYTTALKPNKILSFFLDNGKWTFAILFYRLLKGSYNTSHSPTHSYTDGGGCYARCWPARKERYSASKANHDISMLTHTNGTAIVRSLGISILPQGHITPEQNQQPCDGWLALSHSRPNNKNNVVPEPSRQRYMFLHLKSHHGQS